MQPELQPQEDTKLPIIDPGIADAARQKSASPVMTADITGATNVAPKSDNILTIDGSKKTWGEKVYHNLVYRFFGFGVNLGVSSFLTYLTLHSNWKVPFYGKREDGSDRLIKNVFGEVRGWFQRKWPTRNLPGFGEASLETRADRAKVMASAFVLTFGGHIMIPVIKFFEDKKTTIVEWLDRKHYGEDGVLSPEIQAAHQRIAEEIRPTWLSTALARVGSVLAVQLSARTIGIEKNLIRRGAEKANIPVLKEFSGIDRTAEKLGVETAAKLPTAITAASDSFLIKASGGNKTPYKDTDTGKAEHGITGFLFKYGFSDIIYTVVTAVTIRPMNNWLIRSFSFLRKEPEKKPEPKPAIRNGGMLLDTTPPLAPLSLPLLEDRTSDKPNMNIAAAEAETHGTAVNKQTEKTK